MCKREIETRRIQIHPYIIGGRGRERQKEKQGERQREMWRERERDIKRQKEKESERDREREKQTDRQREATRERERLRGGIQIHHGLTSSTQHFRLTLHLSIECQV